jgi:hypothetical protein
MTAEQELRKDVFGMKNSYISAPNSEFLRREDDHEKMDITPASGMAADGLHNRAARGAGRHE